MKVLFEDWEDLNVSYVTTTEAAARLGIDPKAAGFLVRQGKIPAMKIANRWLIPRDFIEDFAKTYVPKVGRPRTKRKYTRRNQE